MAETSAHEPRGLGEHARGIASENAHQQGWGLNEEQRARSSADATNAVGGDDYDYGARDFGDEPINMGGSKPEDVDKAREMLQKESE
ncbi:hypothetical protein [Terriglobus aquaticus]|uniref:Uncharacterized protein n=1 Tax=Terriglobus aquaticus TaxID=940139 RepID=A0ABW9KLT0_9BACT|nr:hypothetical protein [Terriglobus aquaticus]